MKKLTLLTIVTLMSAQAFAAVNCQPFNQELNAAQRNVEQFEGQVRNIEDRLRSIEDRIQERVSLRASAQNRIDSLLSSINQQEAARQQLIRDRQTVQVNLNNLEAKERALRDSIARNRAIANDPRTSQAARREALRQANVSERELEGLLPQLGPVRGTVQNMTNDIAASENRIRGLQNQLPAAQNEVAAVDNMNPSLQTLENTRRSAEQELRNQDNARVQLNAALAEASERRLMCVTYNHKYPTALEVAKEVYRVKCNRYQLANYQNVEKQNAEQEVLAALCGN